MISTCILTENIYILMRCFHDFQFQKAIIQVLICPWTETILRTVSSQTGKYHFQLRIKTRMKNIKSVNNENVKIQWMLVNSSNQKHFPFTICSLKHFRVYFTAKQVFIIIGNFIGTIWKWKWSEPTRRGPVVWRNIRVPQFWHQYFFTSAAASSFL